MLPSSHNGSCRARCSLAMKTQQHEAIRDSVPKVFIGGCRQALSAQHVPKCQSLSRKIDNINHAFCITTWASELSLSIQQQWKCSPNASSQPRANLTSRPFERYQSQTCSVNPFLASTPLGPWPRQLCNKIISGTPLIIQGETNLQYNLTYTFQRLQISPVKINPTDHKALSQKARWLPL